MTKPVLRATSSAHLCASVWCVSFVTLFNLQGTRSRGGTFAILAHSLLFVKYFFQVLSNFSAARRSGEARLLYHTGARLSSTFFNSFEFTLACQPASCLAPPGSPGQLVYYTTSPPPCQLLFSIFLRNFSKFWWRKIPAT